MADAPNWQLINIVASQLAAIKIDGGYTCDAGDRVDTERPTLTDDAIFPRIAVGEETLTPTAQTVGAITRELVVVAEGAIATEVDTAERDAANLKWDIGRALGRMKPSAVTGIAGITVSKIEVKGDQPTLRTVGESFIAVQVRMTITYTEQLTPSA